ncbi:MAG: ABC transporter ATP-binding protein [Phycisphaerales bacterium]|nr:ABC transporter ATP-binding protein [Phycisphaerales bacterium]
MSNPDRKKDRSIAAFWRACRYLYPHRKLVIISLICALVVGIAFTSGLSAMLPILRVLIYGDSIQGWVDRQIVEQRIDVKLAEDKEALRIVDARRGGIAQQAGLKSGDQIIQASSTDPAAPTPSATAIIPQLHTLADLQLTNYQLQLGSGQQLNLLAREVSWHLRTGQRLAYLLPTDPVASIAIVFGVLASLAIFGNFVRFFQEYYGEKAAILAVEDMRRHLYDHVLHMPLGYFSLKGTSDATSRLVQDAGQLQDGFKAILGKAVQEPIKAAFSFGLALFFSWRLTLLIVIFAPVMVWLIHTFGKKMRRANRKMLQGIALVLGQLEGSLIGIRVVKGAAAEPYERRRYKQVMRQVVGQQIKLSRTDAMSSPIIESLMLLMVGAIMLAAAWMVLKSGTLDPGHFIMVMACLAGMADSLRKVTKVNNALQKSNAAALRIFEMLAVPVERRRKPLAVSRSAAINVAPIEGLGSIVAPAHIAQPIQLKPIQNDITFEDVTFTYAGAASAAVNKVNLTVKKGMSVAIVGRNGSGKTTLLSLLPRFYDVDSGRILIDGIDIRHATLQSLRRQIGIVTQDAVIFPGTIEQNIAYGTELFDRQRVIESARQAFAHDFIMEKPDGYATVLGEHGAQLSGGQKQRICIARAIYRQSPIMILDEATSQIDAESEHLIQQAIEQIMHERTTFVIAHRFSTILSADQIVVMERGGIEGIGKHDDLINSCPIYRQLYERQVFTVSDTPATV